MKSKINEIKLSDASFYALYQFAKSKSLSTYQVFSLLKKTAYKSEYKNVYKKVQNLLSLNLIEKLPKSLDNMEHGAIYYKITSIGIFYLMENMKSDLNFEILKHHGEDPFFKIFLYPYFEKHTLMDLKFDHIKLGVFNYSNSCCRIFKNLFQYLKSIQKDKGIYSWVEFWDALPLYRNDDDYKERFISILKDRFNLKWLDSKAKIENIDEYTITISQYNRVVYLKLNESKTTAVLSYQNKILTEYIIRPLDEKKPNYAMRIEAFEPKTVEQALKDKEEEIHMEIYENIENLSISLLKYCDIRYQFTNAEREHIEDITNIAKDSKFMQVLESAEEKYNKYFSMFKELGKKK
ncbi:MAG TPA: hypothetical protein VJ697_02360 [Nitrososphaeraceae archaeon]|nr:hypothetical protein [Nitrososphaeraceae archaeon]